MNQSRNTCFIIPYGIYFVKLTFVKHFLSYLVELYIQECVDFWTVSLIPHASKILLKILASGLETKAELFLEWDQYEFRRGCGTRDAIAVMWVLCERNMKYNNKVCLFCWLWKRIWLDRLGEVVAYFG